jgi:autotransporter-associated beta strand protein
LTKTGAGTLELTAANSYTGLTTVDSGMFLANNTSGSATGTGTVTVNNDATLGGSGSIGGNTTIASGGTLTGGIDGGIDSLDFSANLNLAAGSTWLVDLVNGATNDSDQISVGGAISLAGSLMINEVSGLFSDGASYQIATYGSRLGYFSNAMTDGAIISSGGGAWRVNYTGGSGPGNITLTAVPEPGTLGLLGAGIVGFAVRRYRRKRATCA